VTGNASVGVAVGTWVLVGVRVSVAVCVGMDVSALPLAAGLAELSAEGVPQEANSEMQIMMAHQNFFIVDPFPHWCFFDGMKIITKNANVQYFTPGTKKNKFKIESVLINYLLTKPQFRAIIYSIILSSI
jgi:hypothetical protein